ncbi:MAG: patatin-like phospholipase family protein [Acidobacteriota bacterium]|nr:patatin-like phospholipase family protein [Acidobacteriota bacterium]
MGAHPLSFSEVLEDEYRYFHGQLRYSVVRFEAKHVREIEDLDRKLNFHRGADKASRWKTLAEAVSSDGDRTDAVVGGLNRLLTKKTLLDELLAEPDHAFPKELRQPQFRRALMRVPIARRMLFENAKISAEIARDPDLINDFCAESAAIRILKAHAPQIFASRPALLAYITDDDVIQREVARDRVKAAQRLVTAARIDPATLREELGFTTRDNDPPPHITIPAAELSRFNAILIEIAYSDYVCDGQGMRAIYAAIHEKEPAALCLSGGGIRSATFNLGVLQGMADHRMLNRFHYISTVSGGGYIGSWLSSWIRRHAEGMVGVAKDLSRAPTDPLQPEVEPIRHLREYSSYLAPRATAFSLDSWTLVATYLRNLLLNWTMLIPALAAALAVPRLLEAFIISSIKSNTTARWGWGSLIMAAIAVSIIGVMRPASELPAAETARSWRRRAIWAWLGTLIVSAFFFCTYWAGPKDIFSERWWILPLAFASGSLIGAVIFGRRYAKQSAEDRADAVKRIRSEVIAAVISGAFAGWLLMFAFSRLFPPGQLTIGRNLEIYICLSVPLYLLVFFAQSTLLVGFTTKRSPDYDREWWARSAAAVIVFCVLHAGASFAVLLLPILVYEFPRLLTPIGGLSGLGSWLLSRKSKAVGGKEAAPKLMPLLRLAATISVLFVVAAIAMLTSGLIGWANREVSNLKAPQAASWSEVLIESTVLGFKPFPPDIPAGHSLFEFSGRYFNELRSTRLPMLFAFLIAAVAVAWIMAVVLNVNIYSMHGMYRNRLIRAYLGASRWSRTPDPFTGFDPQDNIEMWNLRPQCLWPTSFINFEKFAEDLAHKPWWTDPKLDREQKDEESMLLDVEWARAIITKFNGTEDEKEKEEQGNEAMAAVVYTLNNLMRCYDLKNNVAAPRTVRLLENNRTYLEREFDATLKKHRHTAPRLDRGIPALKYPKAKMPKGKEIPEELQRDAEENDREKERLLHVPPLHVVNASLNLVGGDKLAWQERKAASFTVTPLHSGSRALEAYRDTAEYGDKITLGTAMAISGAAVSPNMGALSSPAFTFLMTLFNARLGWWIGNPARKTYDHDSPRMSLASLLMEALGKTNASHDYVFLSDGGHFENLGLYEMVLRRCKYIIVCDASADGRYGFGDLANAVRKIRIDLGVPIEPLVTKYIGPQKDERYGRYCALGKIHYRNVDGGTAVGYLVYIKPAIYSDSPADVRNYANESASFPHETTADQFFSESQFESYRALGRHVIGRICGDKLEERGGVAPNVPTFFANAWAYVNGAEPPVGDMPITNVSDVVSWMGASLGLKEDEPASQT